MEIIDLANFELHDRLGSGADYEVFSALDVCSDELVVLKRPNPDYISRGLHNNVEATSGRLIDLHGSIGHTIGHLAQLIGYTDSSNHDDYFGDSLGGEYRVLVWKRAHGLPLLGNFRDKYKGIPIALAHNLFALYPLVPHAIMGHFGIQDNIMSVQQDFLNNGYVLLDLRPENIFFNPRDGMITVVDSATVFRQNGIQNNISGLPFDFYDFIAEFISFYMPLKSPPEDVAEYGKPWGNYDSFSSHNHVSTIIDTLSLAEDNGPSVFFGIDMLGKVQKRIYSSLEEFKEDFNSYLRMRLEEYKKLPGRGVLMDIWYQAFGLLSDRYWSRFNFDHKVDLLHYTEGYCKK